MVVSGYILVPRTYLSTRGESASGGLGKNSYYPSKYNFTPHPHEDDDRSMSSLYILLIGYEAGVVFTSPSRTCQYISGILASIFHYFSQYVWVISQYVMVTSQYVSVTSQYISRL